MSKTTLQGVSKMPHVGAATPLAQLVDDAVTNAVILAQGVAAPLVAKLLVSEDPELWRDELIRHIVALVTAKRRSMSRANAVQLTFPQFEQQFKHVPKRLVMPDGRRVRKGNATYRQLREFGYSLEARFRDVPLRNEMKAILDLMRPYAQRERGITYNEVKRLESERLGWPE
jgi:hypothetical protein